MLDTLEQPRGGAMQQDDQVGHGIAEIRQVNAYTETFSTAANWATVDGRHTLSGASLVWECVKTFTS